MKDVFRQSALALLAAALVSLALRAAAPPSASVKRLIRQLGSDSFDEREAASKALDRIGERALPALRKAAANPDLEIRKRSARLVSAIQAHVDRTDYPPTPPPRGAVVLFGGKDLDGWVRRGDRGKPVWRLLKGGIVEVAGAGPTGLASRDDILTRQTFAGRFRLHVEFRVPNQRRDTRQVRGNSGVYVQGRYEVQILDSYQRPIDKCSCGAVYGLLAPAVNACKAPQTWQSFDIEFQAPQFRDGRKVKDARITVRHNGVKIHDNAAISGPCDWGLPGELSQPGPILLQNHNDPVQFRNIWLLPLRGDKER
jgi:hypothetical protein